MVAVCSKYSRVSNNHVCISTNFSRLRIPRLIDAARLLDTLDCLRMPACIWFKIQGKKSTNLYNRPIDYCTCTFCTSLWNLVRILSNQVLVASAYPISITIVNRNLKKVLANYSFELHWFLILFGPNIILGLFVTNTSRRRFPTQFRHMFPIFSEKGQRIMQMEGYFSL